jgi:hypothetical protein
MKTSGDGGGLEWGCEPNYYIAGQRYVLAAILRHNVVPKHLMTLHILSCFPINVLCTLLLREQACKTLQECRT